MQFLTQTKWPVPAVVVAVAVLFILENRKVLMADQVQWIIGALAIGGAQAGVHTDKPQKADQ